MSNVVVTLSESDAKWLDEFLQAEYKREGFRPHEKPKPEVQSIGSALQRAMAESMPESVQSGFALTEDELKLCAELPDALVAISDAHDAKASMAAAMGYQKSTDHHAARAEELRTEAKRIEATW